MNGTDYVVFSLGANDALAQKVAKKLKTPLGNIRARTFADGEQHVQLMENVRGRSVYLIQSTNPPAENWVKLFLAIDAAHGASAKEITVVMPYMGYSRQERKSKPREPISARVFSVLLEKLGTTHVVAIDLHTDSIGGFFRKANVDYLYARPVLINHFKKIFKNAIKKDELVVVSPDIGGAARAQSYAKRLMKNADLALIHKEREIPNQVARMRLIGDVKGKTALIIDDMADTCGTLARAAEVLKENGAREVYACATHGLLSGEANKIIDASPIEKLFITDTIATNKTLSSKVEIISVGDLLADAIYRLNHDKSLSALFETD